MSGQIWTPDNPAPLELRVLARVQVNQSRRLQLHSSKQYDTTMERVADAMQTPYHWATNHTKTFNPHWQEESRPSPYEAFPRWPYMEPLFEALQSERIILFEKSRDMMVSWACLAYFTWEAQRVPERRVVIQTQKLKKVIELIDYAKCLYRNQPDWLKDANPLAKNIDDMPGDALRWAHGGEVIGIPGGADQIRSLHPWAYLNDESSFQPAAGDCYDEALSVVKGKIVFNSSAGPSWYADFRRDILIPKEDE